MFKLFGSVRNKLKQSQKGSIQTFVPYLLAGGLLVTAGVIIMGVSYRNA